MVMVGALRAWKRVVTPGEVAARAVLAETRRVKTAERTLITALPSAVCWGVDWRKGRGRVRGGLEGKNRRGRENEELKRPRLCKQFCLMWSSCGVLVAGLPPFFARYRERIS